MNATERTNRKGFTLIELMVVIGIIAILASLLIPAFSAVTSSANNVATQAMISVLERGLESYRNELALGGVYPPSHSDNPAVPLGHVTISDPLLPVASAQVLGISGANLLAYALLGADQLGTPGFNDINNTGGGWWDDMSSAPGGGGAYELDPDTREPLITRYPRVGGSFVDEPTQKGIRTFEQLERERVLAGQVGFAQGVATQPMFTDKWKRPILYYRANRGGREMITTPGATVGVYDNRDNGVITGTNAGNLGLAGIDFGPGENGTENRLHAIGWTTTPGADPDLDTNGVHGILTSPTYNETMERFILNRSVTQRNEPVNRDSFLLISAGEDAVYGTSDDVVNWTREQG